MTEPISIRRYRTSDSTAIRDLFKSAVFQLHSESYTAQQLLIWAGVADEDRFTETLKENMTFVALMNSRIVGFGDLDQSGVLQRLYVHPEFQRKGIATKILQKIEEKACEMSINEISLESSSIGLPFYLRRGFRLTAKRVITRDQVPFLNYVLRKDLKNHQ